MSNLQEGMVVINEKFGITPLIGIIRAVYFVGDGSTWIVAETQDRFQFMGPAANFKQFTADLRMSWTLSDMHKVLSGPRDR